ncbi:MAG: cupin domain-containing protein [Tannerella sp.]|jgi:mannose-6-phosphate isomerase-like protein (cupin superfamily)|nr:cupin domain-containing protein [Tannerella sp.]
MKTGTLFSIGILLLSLHAKAQNRQYAVPGNIESYIDRFELRTSDMNGNGWAHYYIPRGMGDTLTVKMSCVYLGKQTHAPHVHHEDESFYVVRGPVNFHINGEERIFNTGDFVYTPSGSSHNIQRVSEQDTIKYLVIKRETAGHVDKPHPVGKPDYTFDDCITYPSKHTEWTGAGNDAQLVLLDRHFADGFHIVMTRVTDSDKVFPHADSRRPGQAALYILSGRATVTLDGQSSSIGADNTFYCPKNATYSLTKAGTEPLVFLTVTTE